MNQETGGFGATVPMVTGSGLLNPVQVINQPAGFRLAQTFTVEFAINPAPVSPGLPGQPAQGAPIPTNCQATLQWVENGNQVQRVITVGNGVTISGSGTGLQVTLIDLPMGTGYISGQPYQVTALLAPGLRPALQFLPLLVLPTFTSVVAPATQVLGGTPVFVLPFGATATLPIPPNVGVRAVEITAVGNGAGATADVLVSMPAATGGSYKTYAPTSMPEMVTVPSGATQLTISNRSGAVDATITVLWGIDG